MSQKHGFYTPGTNSEIKSWDYVVKNGYPDFMVLFGPLLMR